MSYVGNEIVAAVGSPESGGWLRLRNMDDLGIVEAKIEVSALYGGDGNVYLDIDEMFRIFSEFHGRVKSKRADMVVLPDADIADAEAGTGTEGAQVLRLVRDKKPSVDPAL
jgi:hypothetical protein